MNERMKKSVEVRRQISSSRRQAEKLRSLLSKEEKADLYSDLAGTSRAQWTVWRRAHAAQIEALIDATPAQQSLFHSTDTKVILAAISDCEIGADVMQAIEDTQIFFAGPPHEMTWRAARLYWKVERSARSRGL